MIRPARAAPNHCSVLMLRRATRIGIACHQSRREIADGQDRGVSPRNWRLWVRSNSGQGNQVHKPPTGTAIELLIFSQNALILKCKSGGMRCDQRSAVRSSRPTGGRVSAPSDVGPGAGVQFTLPLRQEDRL
jgi:hypothetical protein